MDETARWNTATTRWLDLTRESLIAHAIRVGQGERGVLLVTADLDEMEKVIEAASKPNMRITQKATPIWLPIAEFLEHVKTHHVDPTASERYRPALEVMDPQRDAALFLASVPAADGSFYSRFLIVNSLTAPVH
jgi:hypothetical protein